MYNNLVLLLFISLYFVVALSVDIPFTINRRIRLPRQTNKRSCSLPQHPNFGRWTIYEKNTDQNPGKLVPSGTILELSCQENYKLDGEDASTCIRGQWKPKISQCLRTCPRIHNTEFMTASCTFNEREVENCEGAIEGTIARFSCAAYYEDQGLEAYPYRLCSKGSWGKTPECVPVCGKKSSDPRLIVGARSAERGEYPWQIALNSASDKILICGGSLINERMALTAAHCVTDLSGKKMPEETYMVAAGKYFRNYDHLEDMNKTQFSPVSEIHIPRQYKGELQNYFGDIAVLVIEKTFVLSHRVQPICMDWGFKRFQTFLKSTTMQQGFVTGWGFTVEHKNPSNVLKVLKVPIIDETECNNNIPPDDRNLITDDKLCAGFVNASASACRGDSGGGLVYEVGGKYYLLAIVSVSPRALTEVGGCNSQQYTLYTNVSYYTERFILDKETRFRPSVFGDLKCNYDPNCGIHLPETVTKPTTKVGNNCIIPSHPLYGKWAFVGQESNNLSPGDSVSPGTTLIIECNQNYHLIQGVNVSNCVEGTWTPSGQCFREFCPPILGTPKMRVTCVDNYTESENCLWATDGTLAKFECAPYYEDLELKMRPTHVCQNGTWDQPTPSCSPVCGQSNVRSPKNFPWDVDVYNLNDSELLCGGTLLTQDIVLTVASCLTDGRENYLPKENFRVAAGLSKKNRTQFSNVKDIFVREEHHPEVFNSAGYIALLVLEKQFKLTAKVQPACINLSQTIEAPTQGYGYIPMKIPVNNDPNVISEKTIKASTFSAAECYKKLPIEAKLVLNYDKYCALVPHTGVLIADRGRGMYEKHDDKYYVIGLTSFFTAFATEENPGTVQNVLLYTMVSKHLNKFIVPQIAKYKTSLL